MALSVLEKIAQIAKHFAAHSSHGYSQENRGKGSAEEIALSDGTKVVISGYDVDCSEMVRQCVNAAISGSYKRPIEYMWTGNEDEELTANGFERISFAKHKVRRGDILWRSGHTGVALNNTQQAEAFYDENHGLGGKSGDQTGDEVAVNPLSSNWTYIYRYAGGSKFVIFPGIQEFTFKKSSRVHVEPRAASRYTYTYQPGESVTIDGVVLAEGYTWGTYIGSQGARRYVIMGTLGRTEK